MSAKVLRMEIIAKRAKRPALSETGEQVLEQYEQRLRTEEDLTAVTIRNYLSDLRHFAAWCEAIWKQGREEEPSFTPEAVPHPRRLLTTDPICRKSFISSQTQSIVA